MILVHIGALTNEEIDEVLSHEGLLVVSQGGLLRIVVGEVGFRTVAVVFVVVGVRGTVVIDLASTVVVGSGTECRRLIKLGTEKPDKIANPIRDLCGEQNCLKNRYTYFFIIQIQSYTNTIVPTFIRTIQK